MPSAHVKNLIEGLRADLAEITAERDVYRQALIDVVSDFIAYAGHPAAMESGYVRKALDMIASSEEGQSNA